MHTDLYVRICVYTIFIYTYTMHIKMCVCILAVLLPDVQQ